jgi:large subunit ribosomal protein L25
MTEQIELPASLRQNTGKNDNRRLRRQKQVPAVIYGADKDNANVIVDHGTIYNLLEEHHLATSLFTVNIEGTKEQVVLKDIQLHPFKPKVMHLDMMRVKAEEAIDMTVPIEFVGSDQAPGVKEGGGVVSHLLDEVEIRCLPRHLPESLTADLSNMQLNDTLHLSDLQLPDGVQVLTLEYGEEDSDLAVASVHAPEPEKTEAELAAESAGLSEDDSEAFGQESES